MCFRTWCPTVASPCRAGLCCAAGTRTGAWGRQRKRGRSWRETASRHSGICSPPGKQRRRRSLAPCAFSSSTLDRLEFYAANLVVWPCSSSSWRLVQANVLQTRRNADLPWVSTQSLPTESRCCWFWTLNPKPARLGRIGADGQSQPPLNKPHTSASGGSTDLRCTQDTIVAAPGPVIACAVGSARDTECTACDPTRRTQLA